MDPRRPAFIGRDGGLETVFTALETYRDAGFSKTAIEIISKELREQGSEGSFLV